MSVLNFKDLKAHIGHKIVCVGYSNKVSDMNKDKKKINWENVAIECETCNEVLLSFDKK